ncbi:MAG: elongation factor G [candidate division FCPU426 bacterium]
MLQNYRTENIHNLLIAGHGQTGKTSLTESLLVASGALPAPGSVDKGTTVSDFDEEEIARKISLKLSLAFVEHQGHKLNLLDAPGSPDFIGEYRAGLHVVDACLILVDAEAGVQVEAEKHARYAQDFQVPRLALVNKLDKEHANFDAAVESISKKFGKPAIPVWLPLGQGAAFKGAIDLLQMKALTFEAGAAKPKAGDIPAEMKDAAAKAKEKVVEAAAEGDDQLTEKFLEGQALSPEEIARGLGESVRAGNCIPVLCGGGNSPACASALLDVLIQLVPHAGLRADAKGFKPGAPDQPLTRPPREDAPFSAYVFKTLIDQYAGKFSFFRVMSGSVAADQDVFNVNLNRKERFSHILNLQGKKTVEVPRAVAGDIAVVAKLESTLSGQTFADPAQPIQYPPLHLPQAVYSVAITPKKKGDEQKLATVLAKLCEEDPTLNFHFVPEIQQSLLAAMGDMQIEITLAKLKKRFNVEVDRQVPRVLYKETVQKPGKGHHKHKKQTGGHGQYGEVYLDIIPLERGTGYVFEDKTVGGSIPRSYIPGVEKGVKEALLRGVLAKYPVIDVGIKVVDGSYHDVDSSEMSFKIAGRKAFYDAMQNSGPVLLEPVMKVVINASDSYMGSVTSDLNSRRGRVLSMGTEQIEAHVPQAELLTYSLDLKAMTSGTASFEMEFSHYQPISGRIAENVIKAAAALHGEEKEEE